MGGEDEDYSRFEGEVETVDIDQQPKVCYFDGEDCQEDEKQDLDDEVVDQTDCLNPLDLEVGQKDLLQALHELVFRHRYFISRKFETR